ncbi:hypothetical protein D3C79_1040340 [compost metagenome]
MTKAQANTSRHQPLASSALIPRRWYSAWPRGRSWPLRLAPRARRSPYSTNITASNSRLASWAALDRLKKPYQVL